MSLTVLEVFDKGRMGEVSSTTFGMVLRLDRKVSKCWAGLDIWQNGSV